LKDSYFQFRNYSISQSLNLSKLQSGFAGGIGQGFHAAMVQVAAAIEHYVRNPLGLSALGDGLADYFGRSQIPAGAPLPLFAFRGIGGD
jgi:hypothetical protein